jgi:hypothetical protein
VGVSVRVVALYAYCMNTHEYPVDSLTLFDPLVLIYITVFMFYGRHVRIM